MPPRKPEMPEGRATTFRARYDDLEKRREELMARVAELARRGTPHPALGRARTLLNTQFRKANLMQRAAVLEAANWLIMMIDRSTMLL
jgi:hypothetical protein